MVAQFGPHNRSSRRCSIVAAIPAQTHSMPIRPYLDGLKFDPETIRVMGLAFEMALVALRLADRGDLAHEVLALAIGPE
jgi:hypothetical protein